MACYFRCIITVALKTERWLAMPLSYHPGTKYLYENGLAKVKYSFHPLLIRAAREMVDAEFPFILTTGRNLYQYHTGTMNQKD